MFNMTMAVGGLEELALADVASELEAKPRFLKAARTIFCRRSTWPAALRREGMGSFIVF
jgi:hypothetical protein